MQEITMPRGGVKRSQVAERGDDVNKASEGPPFSEYLDEEELLRSVCIVVVLRGWMDDVTRGDSRRNWRVGKSSSSCLYIDV